MIQSQHFGLQSLGAHLTEASIRHGVPITQTPEFQAEVNGGLDPRTPVHLLGWVDDFAARRTVAATFARPLAQTAPHLMAVQAEDNVYLYKAWKDALGSYPDYVAQQIGDCFVAGTMVLGERTKPIENVQIGDRVWTAEGKLTTVVSRRVMETHRPMVEIRPQGGVPIRCTADHKWLVYRFERVCGKRVTPNQYKRAVAGAEGIGATKVITQFEARRPEWVAAGDLRDTDCILTPIGFAAVEATAGPGNMFCSELGRYTLGYFLGNGHASGGSAEWTLPKGSPATAKIIESLTRHGFNPKFETYNERQADRVRVHSVELVVWLREQFYESGKKSFPGCMVGDTEFLKGLVASDGSEYDLKNELNSTSLSIIYGAYASLVAQGYDPIIGECSRSHGTYANAKRLYRVTWLNDRKRQKVWRDDKFVCRPVKSVRLIEGPTTVYDIGVRDAHHSFLANGYAVHNCTSFGSGHAVDLLQCVEIVIGKENTVFKEICTEAIYGMGREIAGMLGGGDGCYGVAVAKALTDHGATTREKVGPYSGRRAKEWGGRGGVPASVKQDMSAFKVGKAALITTLDELDAALSNGYPSAGGFSQGFTMSRDADGMCRQSGRWGHETMIGGKRVRGGNREYLMCQSWGPNVPDGPLVDDMPNFSFWINAQSMQSILSQQDWLTFSGAPDFETRPLPASWSYDSFI